MPDFGFGIFQPLQRSIIPGIAADVTIEEDERDEVTVTEHPVEQGAPIGDHAFKRPEEVTVRAGWSEAKTGDISAQSGIYKSLLDWQASFVPFDLITGKRIHKNMLITSMAVITDQTSEYSLMVTLTCREIILTKTQTTGSGIGDSSNQANPEATGNQVDLGVQQPTSILPPDQIGGTGTVDTPLGKIFDFGSLNTPTLSQADPGNLTPGT